MVMKTLPIFTVHNSHSAVVDNWIFRVASLVVLSPGLRLRAPLVFAHRGPRKRRVDPKLLVPWHPDRSKLPPVFPWGIQVYSIFEQILEKSEMVSWMVCSFSWWNRDQVSRHSSSTWRISMGESPLRAEYFFLRYQSPVSLRAAIRVCHSWGRPPLSAHHQGQCPHLVKLQYLGETRNQQQINPNFIALIPPSSPHWEARLLNMLHFLAAGRYISVHC